MSAVISRVGTFSEGTAHVKPWVFHGNFCLGSHSAVEREQILRDWYFGSFDEEFLVMTGGIYRWTTEAD